VSELATTSVFFDFDGTISRTGVGVHLLKRLGDPAWREIDDAYIRGEMGSRDCMSQEWRCLPVHDEPLLQATAREVEIDSGFGPLLDALRKGGAEVTVVSDGFGFYVHDALADYGVEILSNMVDPVSRELTFPNGDPSCPCQQCGTCKQAPIRAARSRGRSTVFIGDGVSDRKAASIADVVYAKARLATWCTEQGVAFTPYERLSDVQHHLLADSER
jgi:2-hydroxy-3-keto-5-methylthiopentenyl-1-phosphate phosphatase